MAQLAGVIFLRRRTVLFAALFFFSYNTYMLEFIKKFIPSSVLKAVRPYYHGIMALNANKYFDEPSAKLVVIGVTGTSGKSTTVKMLAHILNSVGKKCGYTTTVEFFDGQEIFVNKHGLSMPSETKLQMQLKTMVQGGCKYAIVESTSEGLAQNRHLGINFDIALFTNLSPAHLESHGGYEQYKQAKAKLFETLGKSVRKSLFPQKIIGVNADDLQGGFFASFSADKKFGVTFKKNPEDVLINPLYEALVVESGVFELQRVMFTVALPGDFNMYNALLAVACSHMLGVSFTESAAALKNFKKVPGRMEEIENTKGFKIFVDYAPEPLGMQSALKAVGALPHNRIVHVFGATGGHRDVAKRFEFGKISARVSDVIVITNDDIYDSDPQMVAGNIRGGIELVAEDDRKVKQIFTILDRREAIKKALQIGMPNDIIIITGKGSEQFLVLPGNKRIEWDERAVVREELTSSIAPNT